MVYELVNGFNASVTSSVYPWNQELIIILLGIIAFCQIFFLMNMLKTWVLK